MTEIPAALSPLGPGQGPPALAAGPFVVQIMDDTGGTWDIGVSLTRLDAKGVTWTGEHAHHVTPASPPVINGDQIAFTQAGDGAQYVIRPLEAGDAYLAGDGMPDDFPTPDGQKDQANATQVLAQVLLGQFYDFPTPVRMGEDGLYLSRDQTGEPLALFKMSSSYPTLIRDSGFWRPVTEDDEDLFGAVDSPVREDAVLLWDAGDLPKLNDVTLDDRFSPQDAVDLFVELDSSGHVTRLILQRSRSRFYSRQGGRWAPAAPNPDAATVSVVWSAIGAWDDGDLKQLGQVQAYDAEGDQAA